MPDYLMKRGTKGTIVTNLQTYLMSLGYKLPKYGADGDYGAETEAAVRAFQTDNSLPVTGVWTEADQDRLLEVTKPKPVDYPAFLTELESIAARLVVIAKAMRG